MTLPPSVSDSRDESATRDILGPQTCVQLSKSQESCRSESQTSSQNSNLEICRICHCEGDSECGLIAPCYCSGSLRYVHQTCLQQWIKSSNIRCCELCKFQFIMQTKTKPFMKWEPLEMTGFERRKLLCAVMFHAIALTCVVWSLYVLIHRTAEEIQYGLLEWPFWTKLIVVAIGFTGGVVFMYIQCKAYMQICQRWKAFNRVIYVQNAPEKQVMAPTPPPPSAPSVESGTSSGQTVSKSRQFTDAANYKDETSIDLKGVRNLHIFFNDESSACNEGDGTLEAVTVAPASSQRNEDGSSTSWHIKIGKSTGNESSNPPRVYKQQRGYRPSSRSLLTSSSYLSKNVSYRCSESDGKSTTDCTDPNRSCKPNDDASSSKCSDLSSANKNDSVLKLQIKKSEIVIKFGQKTNGEPSNEETPLNDRKDTSVNIKIDDKENDPIVIDVVKKAQVEAAKDPVQIRFDFGQNDDDRLCDKDDNSTSTSKLIPSPSPYCENSNSETDSGSHSPLLVSKSYASSETS